jgi:hypothetical protein
VRAQVPPEERVVLEVAGGDRRRRRLGVVLVGGERARDLRAAQAAEEGGARALQAGVDPEPERRVRGQRAERRQVVAQPVARPDGGLGVRHRDVDVDGARRRPAHQAPVAGEDRRVALGREVGDIAMGGGGVDAGADHGPARAAHPRAERGDRPRRGVGRDGHRRRELDHRRVHVRLRRALGLRDVERVEDRDGRVGQPVALAVDQQQLVLEPEGERRPRAEARRREGVVAHETPLAYRARKARKKP